MSNDTRGSEPESTHPDATSESASAPRTTAEPGTDTPAPTETPAAPTTSDESGKVDRAASADTATILGDSAAAAGSTTAASSTTAAGSTEAAGSTTAAGDSHTAEGATGDQDDSAAGAGPDEGGSGDSATDGAEAAAAGTVVEELDERRSPALIATAIALPIALVVGVLVMGVMANRHPARSALVLGSVQAPAAGGPECSALLPALPEKLGDYTTSELVQPAPVATKAWQLPEGGDAIVLRCGMDRPMEFNRASPLQVVNNVSWFDVRDQTSGATSGTWWAVDRGTYIALTMPDNAGPTPLQEISDAITKVIPQKPLDPGPLPS
ncbi:DUF3515 domain-containing protein [Nocardia sp. NBC_01327]|uniref:DUF3515 domain-containing protein n=1 Tax=Nocardia sp. NBC_01327 TaxID=2903593 RepID=UPI002E0E17C0|nr:DUF3515 domain-containing protein [Nocardia sp. NBC_01327]